MKFLLATAVLALAGCGSSSSPIPLVGGYQILSMNPLEVYVADASRELIVGPTIRAIGIAGNIIVVDCGTDARIVNGFQGTVGFNLIDSASGKVTKNLSQSEAEQSLLEQSESMPVLVSPAAFKRWEICRLRSDFVPALAASDNLEGATCWRSRPSVGDHLPAESAGCSPFCSDLTAVL